jgi:hypothetical protein
VHDPLAFSNLREPWPSLAARRVTIGGQVASYADALAAAEVLQASRTSAIAPVLKSARSPLAGCDYFGAAAPYVEAARLAPKTGRRGAAGRHVTKRAFLQAVALALAVAREQEVIAALEAFSADERYATAIAGEAVSVREHAYAAGVRSSLRSAVARAVAACGARAGQFSCTAETACGTGACRFAAPPYRELTSPAGPGRFTRPANHVRAGQSFAEAQAVAELAAGGGYRAGVQVWDADGLAAGDRAA